MRNTNNWSIYFTLSNQQSTAMNFLFNSSELQGLSHRVFLSASSFVYNSQKASLPSETGYYRLGNYIRA